MNIPMARPEHVGRRVRLAKTYKPSYNGPSYPKGIEGTITALHHAEQVRDGVWVDFDIADAKGLWVPVQYLELIATDYRETLLDMGIGYVIVEVEVDDDRINHRGTQFVSYTFPGVSAGFAIEGDKLKDVPFFWDPILARIQRDYFGNEGGAFMWRLAEDTIEPYQRETEATEHARMGAELMAYRENELGGSDQVCDLLADIMHYCDREGVSFYDELARAKEHYGGEQDDAAEEMIQRLVKVAESKGLTPEDFDEEVYTASEKHPSQGPSNINNGGLEAQIEFLVGTYGGRWEQAEREMNELIEKLASEK